MPTQAPKHPYGARADAPAPDASEEASDVVKLTQMRDRLASLSNEARSIRAQVPREFEPDVERIQEQMHLLGERLSELGSGALYHGGGEAIEDESGQAADATAETEAASDEAVLLGSAAKADDPWDAASANALTRFYELGDAGLGDEEAAAAGQSARSRPVLAVEPAWLDRRFAEIAERIEQSLAEIHPESSLLTIGRRFDQLEMRMASALRGVAMRTDLEELRIAEAQIEDIGAQLDQLRRQLGRLDTIDAHLTTLTAQLSDDRLTKLFEHGDNLERDKGRWESIDNQLAAISSQLSHDRFGELINESMSRNADLEGLADSAAQKAAAHFADKGLLEAHARDLGEVRGLIESLISERRSNDENNASMLETMQQAIVRVLDRIDALEQSRQSAETAPVAIAAPVSAPVADDTHAAMPEPEIAASRPEPMPSEEAYVPPQPSAPVADRDDDAFLPEEPAAGFQTVPFDLDAAFRDERESADRRTDTSDTPARRMNVLRHDFIADAHRAKLKAASKVDTMGSLGAMGNLGQTRMSEGGPAAEESKPVPARGRGRRSFFKSPRILMSILTLLAMVPAALFFMPRTPADGDANAAGAVSAVPAAGYSTSTAGSAASGHAAPAAPTAPSAPALQNGTADPMEGMPSKQSQQWSPDFSSGRRSLSGRRRPGALRRGQQCRNGSAPGRDHHGARRRAGRRPPSDAPQGRAHLGGLGWPGRFGNAGDPDAGARPARERRRHGQHRGADGR